ncbi:hypothetical protein EZS27_041381, partial [termite gut metagenome]
EYTNKLIRQYIPKKEAFTDYTDEQIVNIQHKLNRRPRKLLNFDYQYYAPLLKKKLEKFHTANRLHCRLFLFICYLLSEGIKL